MQVIIWLGNTGFVGEATGPLEAFTIALARYRAQHPPQPKLFRYASVATSSNFPVVRIGDEEISVEVRRSKEFA